MGQNFVNELLIFDTGDHFDESSTMGADFNINVEHPFQPLSPGHGGVAFIWRFFLSTVFIVRLCPAWMV